MVSASHGEIAKLFAWWQEHIKGYHLYAGIRSGLMVQILFSLIAFIL